VKRDAENVRVLNPTESFLIWLIKLPPQRSSDNLLTSHMGAECADAQHG
jgi:hypothetical protein